MSAEATGWVFRYSPFAGAAFGVHLAIADSVNDQNENEFWMSLERLAKKSRISRPTVSKVVAMFVAEGWIELLEERPGSTSRYRFMFPEDVKVEYETRRLGRYGGVTGANDPPLAGPTPPSPGPTTPVGRANGIEPKRTQAEPKVEVLLSASGASQQELFGAVAQVCGWDTTNPLTKNALTHLGSVAKQLRSVGATAEEVAAFAAAYRAHWPTMDLTPGAIVKYWAVWRTWQPEQPRRGVTAADRAMQWALGEEARNGQDGGGEGGVPARGVVPALPDWGDDDRSLG